MLCSSENVSKRNCYSLMRGAPGLGSSPVGQSLGLPTLPTGHQSQGLSKPVTRALSPVHRHHPPTEDAMQYCSSLNGRVYQTSVGKSNPQPMGPTCCRLAVKVVA